MGAVALTEVRDLGSGIAVGTRWKVAKATFSSSYATGGDTVAAANTLGLRRITQAFQVIGAATRLNGALSAAPGTPGYKVTLAGTDVAPKLLLTKGATSPAEETNATNVSTVTTYVIFEGEPV